MITFKIVFTFDGFFLVLKPHAPLSCILYKKQTHGLKNLPKVHWSRTNEHQESTGPEKCSTGSEWRK